ncbi:hypothetical protein IPL85_01160 [Candidatus Saccharibacteria bacterium]|nr:MAG: hypothetical protein IPL85_01160 [Candidatus Saccharibacteria bacterium]
MKKWLIGIAAAIVLGIGTGGFIWWNQSAVTTVVTTDQEESRAVLGSQEKLFTWKTEHFITRAPSSLRVVSSNEVAQGMTTGQYLLGSTLLRRDDQLGVTVGTLGTMQLEELSAIKLRRLQSDVYAVSTRPFAPASALVFTKADTYETAVYWAQGSNYAAVVVSGSSVHKADLESTLEAVVTNWQWK